MLWDHSGICGSDCAFLCVACMGDVELAVLKYIPRYDIEESISRNGGYNKEIFCAYIC